MPTVTTTCSKCGAQFQWNSDSMEMPDCPNCGYNQVKIDRTKHTKCCEAIKIGDIESVKWIFVDPDVKKNINAGPWTMLHHAVEGNNLELVTYFLKQGANPNISYPQTSKDTPLHVAARKGYVQIGNALIAAGAYTDLVNSQGKKPLDVARDTGDTNMVALLQKSTAEIVCTGAEAEALQEAAKKGDLVTLRKMLENGANVNGRDDRVKRTALHCAAMEGQTEAVALLIQSGAEVNVKDDWGRMTPLHWAAHTGSIDVVKLLIENGADVNAPNSDKWNKMTPLHEAAKEGHAEVVLLLLQNGADPEAKTGVGCTALWHASEVWRKPEVVRVIRNFKARNQKSAEKALGKKSQAAGSSALKPNLTEKTSGIPSQIASPPVVKPTIKVKPPEEKEGCFIATACYGSEHSPEVVLLRNFRDRFLLRRSSGRLFVRLYYLFSPPVAEIISRHHQLRSLIRGILIAPLLRIVSFFYIDMEGQ